jgi:hypothetical protein
VVLVRRGSASAWLLAGALLVPHATAQMPSAPPPEQDSVRSMYGPARHVELERIASSPENYQRQTVVTKGFLEPLDFRAYWSLSVGGARVLLVLGDGYGSDIQTLQGRHVEVTGVVRLLKSCAREPPCQIGHCTLCDDPDLPPLPDPRAEWPRASITIFSLFDISPSGERAREKEQPSLADVIADPGSMAGREVRIVGQFRGRNLFGDLPAESQRSTSDWVLKEGEHAVWVTGKKPQGKGWRLDLELKTETRWWLEVVGSATVAHGVVYVRAKRVSLTTAPAGTTEDRE